MMKQSRDFARVFSENWNRKLKSVRLLGAVVSLCMLVCAVLCMHSAVPMHQALKTAAALVIIARECISWWIITICRFFYGMGER